ncbi:hypothetical protein [Enterococcus sp.]|uniref:hypothetical protein n=1 Tax=Enterococcus sp. TaxID=35783 RepID=UPI002FC5E3A3
MTTKELINGMNHKLKFLSYLILQLFVSFSLPWLNQSIIDNVLIAQQRSPSMVNQESICLKDKNNELLSHEFFYEIRMLLY